MSPIEELRSAEALLRKRAGAATPGPWRYDPDMFDNGAVMSDSPEVNPGWGCLVGETTSERTADSEWRATMDPVVGLALADWLDAVHTQVEQRSAATLDIGVEQAIADAAVEMAVPHALTLARLILAGSS